MSPLLPGIIASGISGHLFTPEGSAYEIASYTVPSGGVASVILAVPTGYRHLQIETTYIPSTNSNFWIQPNSDSSTSYSTHGLYGDGSSVGAESYSNQNTGLFMSYGAGSQVCSAIVSLLDCSSTTKYKTIKSLNGYDANGSGTISIRSGSWMKTEPVASLKIYAQAGNFSANSTFTLIGYK